MDEDPGAPLEDSLAEDCPDGDWVDDPAADGVGVPPPADEVGDACSVLDEPPPAFGF